MASKNRGKPLDPQGTRNAILEAALKRLAEIGPEGISLSEVARLAEVDRGTAYRHFQTREELVRAAVNRVSDKLLAAVYGEPAGGVEPRFKSAADIMEKNDRLLNFGMEHPELCRIWLFEVLSSSDPASDPFWKVYSDSYAAFAGTEGAQEHLNTEVLPVIMLASSFFWPIWVRAQAQNDKQRRELARSFSDECLRLTMYGSVKPEYFPEIADHLKSVAGAGKVAKPRRRTAAIEK